MTDRLPVESWESLFRAQVAVMRDLTRDFPTGEISINEYDVLLNLSRQPDRAARLRDLTQHVLLTQPSVSRLVDRLAARNLVEKAEDPNDGRGTRVHLTDEGFAMFRRVAMRHMAAIASRMSVLDEAEMATLARLAEKLRRGYA